MMPVYVAACHADRLAAEGISIQTRTGADANADESKMLQSSSRVAPLQHGLLCRR